MEIYLLAVQSLASTQRGSKLFCYLLSRDAGLSHVRGQSSLKVCGGMLKDFKASTAVTVRILDHRPAKGRGSLSRGS